MRCDHGSQQSPAQPCAVYLTQGTRVMPTTTYPLFQYKFDKYKRRLLQLVTEIPAPSQTSIKSLYDYNIFTCIYII